LKSLEGDSGFEICLQPEADFLDEEGTEPILSAGFSFYPANGTVPEVLVARSGLRAGKCLEGPWCQGGDAREP
jgi:hypothetical protein